STDQMTMPVHLLPGIPVNWRPGAHAPGWVDRHSPTLATRSPRATMSWTSKRTREYVVRGTRVVTVNVVVMSGSSQFPSATIRPLASPWPGPYASRATDVGQMESAVVGLDANVSATVFS